MEILIDELRKAVENNLYFIAINITLTIPDICSALESENGKTRGTKYIRWVDTYFADKYDGFINGEDIWKIRCSSLHQGKYDYDNPRFEKIIFQIDRNGSSIHSNIMKNAFHLDVRIFVEDMIDSYHKWREKNKNNSFVAVNSSKGFKYYKEGVPGLGNVGSFIG